MEIPVHCKNNVFKTSSDKASSWSLNSCLKLELAYDDKQLRFYRPIMSHWSVHLSASLWNYYRTIIEANLVVRQGFDLCRTVHFPFLDLFIQLPIFHFDSITTFNQRLKISKIQKKSRWPRKMKILKLGRKEFLKIK